MRVVCDMVHTITVVCIKEHMGPCHTEEELQEIRASQEDIVKTLFYDMADYFDFSISQCSAFSDGDFQPFNEVDDGDTEQSGANHLLSTSILSWTIIVGALLVP